MTSAQFKLDMFEGPLDLLLHLITKHKLNIYDIEISSLLEQYMEYIDNLEHEDLDDAADFLEMAARLIYIKTCSLLPQDEEAEEMKKELEGRLIEYSLCKLAAQELKNMYVGGEVFVRQPAKVPVDKTYRREHDPQVLYDAFMGLSEKTRREKPLNAQIFEPLVSHKVVSLTSKIIFVLKKLHIDGECDLSHIYDGMSTKSERVATFLAILELTKSGRIHLNDDNTMISFNEESRKKKKSVEDEISEIEVNSESGEDITAFDYAENDTDETEEDNEIPEFVADDDIQTKPTYKHYNDYQPKPVNKPTENNFERVAVECAAVVTSSRLEQIYVPTVEETDDNSENSDLIQEESAEVSQNKIFVEDNNDAVDEETEKSEEILQTEEPVETFEAEKTETDFETALSSEQENITDKTELTEKNVYNEPVIPQEILELMNLPQNEPVSVFKPNYWGRLSYFWGISAVGDDNSRNFWKYGKYRK